ncbi:MAG: hypothetical protein WCF61_09270 [Terriglobales bacterium]
MFVIERVRAAAEIREQSEMNTVVNTLAAAGHRPVLRSMVTAATHVAALHESSLGVDILASRDLAIAPCNSRQTLQSVTYYSPARKGSQIGATLFNPSTRLYSFSRYDITLLLQVFLIFARQSNKQFEAALTDDGSVE